MINVTKSIYAVVDANNANTVLEYQMTAADALTSARYYQANKHMHYHPVVYKTPILSWCVGDDFKFIQLSYSTDTGLAGYVLKNIATDRRSKKILPELYVVSWHFNGKYLTKYFKDILSARVYRGQLLSTQDSRLSGVDLYAVDVCDVDPDKAEIDTRYEEIVQVDGDNFLIIANQYKICH